MANDGDTVTSGVVSKLEWLRASVSAPGGRRRLDVGMDRRAVQAGQDRRRRADADLNELFRLGTAPTDLHGATEGMLVMTTTNERFDAVVRLITSMWMPWQGKRFDKDAAKATTA